jgi:hypothetical protein
VCVDGVGESSCGLNVLMWDLLASVAIPLSAALGAIVGAWLGSAVTFFRRRGGADS